MLFCIKTETFHNHFERLNKGRQVLLVFSLLKEAAITNLEICKELSHNILLLYATVLSILKSLLLFYVVNFSLFLLLNLKKIVNIWDKVFKSGPSKI